MKQLGIIVAISKNNVIGVNNKIPWHYPADLKRFKEITLNKTIIMGKNTFESIGNKPLPNRRNIVITRQKYNNIETYENIPKALNYCQNEEIWFIGGEKIYKEALSIVNVVDITHIPLEIREENVVKFPYFNKLKWVSGGIIEHEFDNKLTREVFKRI